MLSCTKHDVYTFLFYFLRLLCSHSSHSMRHPFWDSAAAHSPSGNELNPSSQEDAHFSGCCTLAYNLQFMLRHPLWDLGTAHSPSGKELKLSSLEESCFSGLILLLMFSYDLAWALLGLVLTHITH